MVPIQQNNQLPTRWQVDYIEPLSLWKGYALFLPEQTLTQIKIYLPCPHASDETTIHEFIKCLIYHHGILYSVVSYQGIHSKLSALRSSLMEFAGLTKFSIILEHLT